MFNSVKRMLLRYCGIAALGAGFIVGCNPSGAPVVPPTPQQIQQNLASAVFLLESVGCPVAVAAAAAAPIVTIAGDAKGNQILTATGASSATLCTMAVPPTALPAPVPANAPPISVTVPAGAAAAPTS